MKLELKRIREAKKVTQEEMTKLLSELIGMEVKKRTYGSWERQEVGMSLEVAYNCAVALNCTIDEIAGREPASPALSQDEHALLSDYRHLTPREKSAVRATASAMADDGRAKSTETAEAV